MGFALDLAFVFSRAERVDESRALLLVQVKGAVCHQAYQVVASVRLKVPWASHGEQFTKYSVTPPLLLHQWGLTLGLLLPASADATPANAPNTPDKAPMPETAAKTGQT